MKFSVSLFCLLALSGLLQGCSGNDGNECQGYVEGEYVYLSSARAGRLEKLLARKGSSVESGVLLASLESEYERQAVAKSERSLAQTRALYNDMLTGKRPAEVSMAKAQLAKARADQANASAELARVEALYRQNAVSKKELDNQRAVSRSADATVVEMQKQVDVYNLPEREQRIAAQKAAVEADEAALAQARVLHHPAGLPCRSCCGCFRRCDLDPCRIVQPQGQLIAVDLQLHGVPHGRKFHQRDLLAGDQPHIQKMLAEFSRSAHCIDHGTFADLQFL